MFDPVAAGLPLIYEQNFDTIDPADFAYDLRGEHCQPQNGECQYFMPYDPVNFHVISNSWLWLYARRGWPNPWNMPWAAGMISTFERFAFCRGYLETRLIIPDGDLVFPSFWFLCMPESGGEVDLMEYWARDRPMLQIQGTPTSADFTVPHVFGLLKTDSEFVFYMDGREILRKPKGFKVQTSPAWTKACHYIIGMLPIFKTDAWGVGHGFGQPDVVRLGIDYIRVWSHDGNRVNDPNCYAKWSSPEPVGPGGSGGTEPPQPPPSPPPAEALSIAWGSDAPADGAVVDKTITFHVSLTGPVKNVELLPRGSWTPKLGSVTLAASAKSATITFDPTTVAVGDLAVTVVAFDKLSGESGAKYASTNARTFTIKRIPDIPPPPPLKDLADQALAAVSDAHGAADKALDLVNRIRQAVE